jgi:uncharacterized membrane protein
VPDVSPVVLAVVAVVWAVVFSALVYLRHDRFASFSFDMGIFDQAIWLLSRFDGQFITVRGLDVFGHHASVGFYLFVPFYWLGAGPHVLNIAQVLVAASGAVPVYLLARYRFSDGWAALALGTAFLLHPALQFMMWEHFHPETIAITPLLFAYWFSVRERWGWFAACAVLAVSFKEDVALAVAVLGVLIALRGHRRTGLLTAGLALGWFFFVTRLLLPAINGTEAFYVNFFGDLGDSMGEIAWNAVRHPSRIIERLTAPDALDYLYKMTAPFAFMPLAAPLVLLIGVPQTVVNLISVNSFTREITFHYAALPLAGLILATVEGIWLSTRALRLRRILAAAVLATSLAATVGWGLSPIGREYRKGWWPLVEDSRRQVKEAALAMVPDGASVSASYHFVPHLSQRKAIFEYPNPFRPSNWGVRDENYPPPTAAEWLVIDRQILGPTDRELLDRLLTGGEFQPLFDREDVVVARRLPTSPS